MNNIDDVFLRSLRAHVVNRTQVVSPNVQAIRPASKVMPGEIRSLSFVNSDGDKDQCLVAVVTAPEDNTRIIQVMLVGHDDYFAGRNDVLLNSQECPMSTPAVLQTDLCFPALLDDIGLVYSVLLPDTWQLVSQMLRKSGRDAGRAGLQSDDASLLRSDYLDEQMQIVRSASSAALSVIHSTPTVVRDLAALGLSGHKVDAGTIAGHDSLAKVYSLIAIKDEKEERRQLRELQRTREAHRLSIPRKVSGL